MLGALLYLTRRSVLNALGMRVRRLREPRYAIGLLFGAGYLVLALGRAWFGGARRHAADTSVAAFLAVHQGALETGAAAALLVFALLAWLFAGTSRPALSFTPAEVQWLFAAPVPRRALIHYKILRSQIGAAVGSLVVTLVVHAGNLVSGWPLFAGIWIVMVSVNLHVTGVSLRRASLVEHGRAGLARHWAPLLVIAAALAVVVRAVVSHWPVLASLGAGQALVGEIDTIGHTGLAGIVLAPFVALVRPTLASTPVAFLAAAPAAVAILAANYAWVVRSDAAFEEAAATYAEQQMVARREGRVAATPRARVAPFVLAPLGRPETALLWKNILQVGRYMSLRLLTRVAAIVLVWGLVLSRSTQGVAPALAAIAAFAAGMTTIFGSQWVRNDLRGDLAHLATLRSWPVTGAAIVRGEVLAPTVMLSAVVWMLVLLAGVLSSRDLFAVSTVAFGRLSLVGAVLVLAPGIILTQVVVQNAMAAFFPAWVIAGDARSRGVDVMGQRLLMTGALVLALAIALVPAAFAAVIVGAAIHAFTGLVPIVASAAAASAVLAVEAALGIEIIGRAVDRADIGAITPPQ
jgi:hypothetical protein